MNKLVIFDLDGTLAESKQAVTPEVGEALGTLLEATRVAIVSGGALPQILKQVVARLPDTARLSHLYLLPTSGAALYENEHGEWKKIFEERLTEKDAQTIEAMMRAGAEETGLVDFNDAAWGDRVEYRGSQVTFSALGQQAPLALKKAWDPDRVKRHALQEAIARRLPDFQVGIGGATTIDVTKRGIDKAYGVHKLCDRLGIPEAEALYIGDELEKGGNDEPIFKTDVPVRAVTSPDDTYRVVLELIKQSS